MDPDQCLRELLELLRQLAQGKDVREEAVEHLRSLASWLERGGFPPKLQTLQEGGNT
jgi:hypothetical protein